MLRAGACLRARALTLACARAPALARACVLARSRALALVLLLVLLLLMLLIVSPPAYMPLEYDAYVKLYRERTSRRKPTHHSFFTLIILVLRIQLCIYVVN